MTSLKLRLKPSDERILAAVTAGNAALTRHRAGHAALRLGLRIIAEDREALDQELRAMAARGPAEMQGK